MGLSLIINPKSLILLNVPTNEDMKFLICLIMKVIESVKISVICVICVQKNIGHGAEVAFRNLRIKELKK